VLLVENEHYAEYVDCSPEYLEKILLREQNHQNNKEESFSDSSLTTSNAH
jgi:hypothetical protein